MVICVLVGLASRGVARQGDFVKFCAQSVDSCCQDPHGSSGPVESHHDGDGCPSNHHHHLGCCSQALPLALENDLIYRLESPGSSLLSVLHESEVPPEAPILGSEKPPLI